MSYYRYITQEVIDSGRYVPPNAEAAEEARQYNLEMSYNLRKKGAYLQLTEAYRTIHIIVFLIVLCYVLKPVIFPGVGGVNLASVIISGLGYLYLLLRYVFRSPILSATDDPRMKVDSTEGPHDSSINLAAIGGIIMVITGLALLPHTFTINYGAALIAAAAHLIPLIFYVSKPMRYKLPFSLAAAAVPVFVTWQTAPFSLLMMIVTVLADRKLRVLSRMDGFPDFVPITVRFTTDGAVKVDSYDKFNRFDGIDDEMESL